MNEKIRYMLFIDPGSEVWKIVILTRVDSLATFILLPRAVVSGLAGWQGVADQ
jgi:hypothetical protein